MRNRGRGLTPLGLALALAAVPATGWAAPSSPDGGLILRDLLPPAAAPETAEGVAAPEAVRVDFELLRAAPEALWLEPVAGEGRWAYRTDLELGPAGDVVWRGRFAEDDPDYTSVTLSLHAGLASGTLHLPGGPTYLLRPRAGGGWDLRAEDPGVFHCDVGGETGTGGPAEAAAGAAGAGPAPYPSPALDHVDAGAGADREVYILVLYTPRAAARLSAQAIVAAAHHNIDVLNSSFGNSGIDGHATLAAVVQADFGLSNMNPGEALGHIIHHPLAQQLQNYWRADVVSVVVQTSDEVPSGCGYANVMFRSLLGPQMADQAYNLVGDGCFVASATFTHEVGHNFGAQHNRENAPPPEQAAYPFSFAHGVDGHFRTLMSYSSACNDCSLIDDVFSSPLRTIDGIPTGVTDQRDNARTLNLTFPLVASFRSGVPPSAPPAPTAPAAPTDLSAEALSPTEVALAWTDHAGNETGYEVERFVAGGAGGGAWQRIAQRPRNTTSHTVTGLEPDTVHRFRVRAVRNNSASEYSNEATAATPPDLPSAPAGLAAEALSPAEVRLTWEAVETATGYEVELHTADPAGDRGAAPIALEPDGAVVDGLEAATPYTFRVRAVNDRGASPWSAPASATTTGPGGPCAADGSALCLVGGRFEVRARWRNPRAPFGHGAAEAEAAPGSGRAGLFTFFNPANAELVVKMIDGRPLNGAFWLFYGALSDVEYWVSVRDAEAGTGRTYHNEPFELCGRGDTGAFAEAASGAAAGPLATVLAGAPTAPFSSPPSTVGAETSGACTPGPEALCLAGGRFRVEVEWENPHPPGGSGVGHVLSNLGTDLTGHFWFFRADNPELAVKILDGRSINGHFWIFWGGLSDVGYTIHVTDTESGESHDFENPPLTLCGGAVTDFL